MERRCVRAAGGNWLQGVKSRTGCSGSEDLLHQVTIQRRPMQTQWAHSTITRRPMPSPRSHRVAHGVGRLFWRVWVSLIRSSAATARAGGKNRLVWRDSVESVEPIRCLKASCCGVMPLLLCGSPVPEALDCLWVLIHGASRETRTLTLLPTADFESAASTDSAIEAQWARSIGMRCGAVNHLAWSE